MIVIGVVDKEGRLFILPGDEEQIDYEVGIMSDPFTEEVLFIHYVPDDVPFIMNGERWK